MSVWLNAALCTFDTWSCVSPPYGGEVGQVRGRRTDSGNQT